MARIHLSAHGGDGAHQVVAGHERKGRLVVVLAPAHLLLGEGDPGGLHPQADLTGPRGCHGPGGDIQRFGIDDPGKNDLSDQLLMAGACSGGKRNRHDAPYGVCSVSHLEG